MASGLFNLKRDFQIAEVMAWHRMTKLKKPEKTDFPEIRSFPLFYRDANGVEMPMVHGNRKFLVPVAMDDMLPVAPDYCGETLIDKDETGCPAKEKDTRGTYSLFTPQQAWDWVAEVLAGTEFNTSSIGMLWNRSFWFISTELTELKSVSCGDGRETRFQLNFSGGLDKSVSPQCELSSIVAVCHNTISLSRATGNVLFHERATKHFTDRLDAAKSEVAKAVGMAAVFKASCDMLAKQACDQDRAKRIFAGYITPTGAKAMSTKTANMVDELTNLHVNGIGNSGNTEWDMLNAYTQLLTRGTEDSKIPMGRRFASAEFGNNADSKANFYNVLTVKRNDDAMSLADIEERGAELLAA
jgi:hypothetical protein